MQEIINVLEQIISEKEPDKSKLIERFQKWVWDIEDDRFFNGNTYLFDILSNLANDLNFYVPDQKRNGDNFYFGEVKLHKTITEAIKEIKKINEKDN